MTVNNVRSIRPGFGMHPKHFKDVLGRKALADLDTGTALSFELIERIERIEH